MPRPADAFAAETIPPGGATFDALGDFQFGAAFLGWHSLDIVRSERADDALQTKARGIGDDRRLVDGTQIPREWPI